MSESNKRPVIVIDGQMYTLDDNGALWNVNAIADRGSIRFDGYGYANCRSNSAEIIDWRWKVDEFDSYPHHHARALEFLGGAA